MNEFLHKAMKRVTPLVFGLSLAVIVGLGILMLAERAEKMSQTSSRNGDEYRALSEQLSTEEEKEAEPLVMDDAGNNNQDLNEVFTAFTAQDIAKGQVDWQAPEDLGDLGWTDKDVFDGSYDTDEGHSYGVKYLKVGTVKSGKYADSEVILVASRIFSDGPFGYAPGLSHYLRRGQEVVFLPNASAANGDVKQQISLETIQKEKKRIPKQVMYAPNETVDAETRMVELGMYPKEFTGRSDREVFEKNEYAGAAFFSEERLKPAFSHPQFGQVWMTDAASNQEPSFELNSYLGVKTDTGGKTSKVVRVKRYYDPIAIGGFYFKRADGITESYHLKFDIFDRFDREGVLLATWNDGSRNEDQYEEYPGGCGLSAYAYDVTGQLSLTKDLVEIGRTDQGDTLYGYKDTTIKGLKDMYQFFQTGYATLQDKTATKSQFLAMHPAVFWVDPFGRLLEFQNANLIPLAECGKPVVYLYPKKTTEVSVKVLPDEGVSVSEPAYHEGWKVIAEPDGTLTNLADGQRYPSLFWEGGSSVLYQSPDQGFVVSNDELEKFFDEKLAQIGLVGREIGDFKEFWIPKMKESQKPYFFVTFLPREQIDAMAPLRIEPKPETVIRVMMDYEGLDTPKTVVGYPLHAPERRGFTAVEWGGRLKD